jgi:hypothetical protein
MSATTATPATPAVTRVTEHDSSGSQERADWLDALRTHRQFLIGTTRDMTDEQASARSTVSELTLAGLIKHVTQSESQWARFIVDGAEAFADEPWVGLDWEGLAALSAETTAELTAEYQAGFAMLPGETLAGLLAGYERIAARTDELVASVDLDLVHPLPVAPWHEPGSAWSVRRALAHIVAETAQHAGHADIIREAIDGAKSMG